MRRDPFHPRSPGQLADAPSWYQSAFEHYRKRQLVRERKRVYKRERVCRGYILRQKDGHLARPLAEHKFRLVLDYPMPELWSVPAEETIVTEFKDKGLLINEDMAPWARISRPRWIFEPLPSCSEKSNLYDLFERNVHRVYRRLAELPCRDTWMCLIVLGVTAAFLTLLWE